LYILKQYKLTPKINTTPQNTGGKIPAHTGSTFKPVHLLGVT
jgi:hypothetical protein